MSAPTAQAERVTCPEARNRVRSMLQPLCEKLPARRADQLRQDACLVTSELITNAMLHGGGVSDFDAHVDDQVLTVRVSDHSTAPPRRLPRAPERAGGFGWSIVRHLSSHVDVALGDEGKTVTVTLDAARLPAP
ncbi:ATP-binding protein [Streptomyces endophyticus]|uniref:ATP-binding protein n=1 Tax=Streptomyces endophyticus TaxID=714166 RepID=A0ABU6F2A7_9ACTN|nr:ATP-binding protein [Streptomyces endophyticus]MEB8338141.1 ATP-binding protein [Streptomyces endophyticus]